MVFRSKRDTLKEKKKYCEAIVVYGKLDLESWTNGGKLAFMFRGCVCKVHSRRRTAAAAAWSPSSGLFWVFFFFPGNQQTVSVAQQWSTSMQSESTQEPDGSKREKG